MSRFLWLRWERQPNSVIFLSNCSFDQSDMLWKRADAKISNVIISHHYSTGQSLSNLCCQETSNQRSVERFLCENNNFAADNKLVWFLRPENNRLENAWVLFKTGGESAWTSASYCVDRLFKFICGLFFVFFCFAGFVIVDRWTATSKRVCGVYNSSFTTFNNVIIICVYKCRVFQSFRLGKNASARDVVASLLANVNFSNCC